MSEPSVSMDLSILLVHSNSNRRRCWHISSNESPDLLAHLQNGISDWKAGSVHATIIANKFDAKFAK